MNGVDACVGPPELTIIIPVWDDYVEFLDEAITSIHPQATYTPMQLIVVNNASRRPLPPLPPDVRTIRNSTRVTVGEARNIGLRYTTTPFVSFADADDIFPPGYFAFGLDRLQRNESLIVVATRPIAFDPATGTERLLRWPTDGAITAARRDRRLLAVRGLLKEPSIVMSGSVFRTDAIRLAGGYSDLSYGEDANLALLLPFIGDIEIHRAPNRRYRLHERSLARNTPHRTQLQSVYLDARRRLRAHAAVPIWAKALLPLVYLHHRRRITQALNGAQHRKLRSVLS